MSMKFPLIVNGKSKEILIVHNLLNTLTKVKFDKFIESTKGKLITNVVWPLILTCSYDGMHLKISVSYQEEKHVFSVTVNGIDYYDLPYKAL